MTFQFTAAAATWERFFELATIGYHLKNIAVEVQTNGLLVSAVNKPFKNSWALVEDRNFETKGKGFFVINTEEIKKMIRLMEDSDVEYTGSSDGNTLELFSLEGDNMSPTLESFDLHKDESNAESTWVEAVAIDETLKKRWYTRIFTVKTLPILAEPPQIGEAKSPGPYNQIIKLDADDLRKAVKRAKILGEEMIGMRTYKGKRIIEIKIQSDDFRHYKELPIKFNAKYNWEEKFDEPITQIFSLAKGDIHLAMTNKKIPVLESRDEEGNFTALTDNTAGLWVVMQEENLSACYMISQPAKETE